ncbi:MAG: hypothetical protein ACRDIF_01365, partial [Actinomycetota bacterium]
LSTREAPRMTEAAEAIRVSYPDGPHNAEALMVHPVTGDIYIATKDGVGVSRVYKLPAPASLASTNVLTLIAELTVGEPEDLRGSRIVTGGDIAAGGRRAILSTYGRGYEFSLWWRPHLPFDEIWRQPMLEVTLPPRLQGESIAYRLDTKALLTTSERLPAPLHEMVQDPLILPPRPPRGG